MITLKFNHSNHHGATKPHLTTLETPEIIGADKENHRNSGDPGLNPSNPTP